AACSMSLKCCLFCTRMINPLVDSKSNIQEKPEKNNQVTDVIVVHDQPLTRVPACNSNVHVPLLADATSPAALSALPSSGSILPASRRLPAPSRRVPVAASPAHTLRPRRIAG